MQKVSQKSWGDIQAKQKHKSLKEESVFAESQVVWLGAGGIIAMSPKLSELHLGFLICAIPIIQV